MHEMSNASVVCYDDNCDPLPSELFILIGLGKKKISEFCRMRVFNTLFGWEEVEDCVKEVFWPEILHLNEFKTTEHRQLYHKLANRKNDELLDTIENDGVRERFAVRTKTHGQMIRADPDKLVRVIFAYGNFDPEVYYKQAYVFITTLLFNYLHDECDVFFALCRIMITLGWHEHHIEPFPRQKIITAELKNYITFSLPDLACQLNKDG